ncbi:HD family phosphohydrolase [Isachenkonia alkalipeptolytica]|uniref:HDIG domain-containing protein n=1 Tax=Isachenkonia alkalipeptolytica TaxID=2565777 RepID=A0AA44BEJ5_9CLOT|nr:HDIG domain-containing metalloprotein [Isachenkonia alkalipeptolytica]NBG89324.1 HDIG domain-containing protein [Isachenkonia alkalipeptolytica]
MKIYSSIFNKISNSRIKKLLSKSAVQYLLLVLFLLLGTLGIFILSLRPDKVDVNLGQRAPQNIHAPKTIEDVRTTENLRNEASNAVEAQFRIDSDVRNEVQRDIENTFEILYSVKEDEDLTEEEKTKAMQDENPVTLGENIITGALSDSRESIEHLESYLYEIAAEQLNGGIRLEDLPTVKASAEESIRSLDDFSEPLKLFGIRLFSQSIRPNEFYDAQRTEELKQQAMEDVDSVIIGQDELIVREGERISASQMQILRELGLLAEDGRLDYLLYLGIIIIVMLLLLTLVFYLMFFHKKLIYDLKSLLMLVLIILSTLMISKVFSVIGIFVIPVATAAMLLSILINPQVAIVSNIILSVMAVLIIDNSLTLLIMLMVGGTLGALMAYRTQQRGNILLSGFVVGAANFFVIMGIGFINSNEINEIFIHAGYGAIGGGFAAVLTIGTLPFWEWAFGVLTHLKLMEMSNPNQPLLKKLLLEAPGTYHHSIIVGNLSEAAADAVEGNALLARVGAFYHDIGKTTKPYFFKENQFGVDNPHEKIKPLKSSSIITGHVTDGLKVAKEHKLHKDVVEFIKSHHGNTLVAYFYHKEKELNKGMGGVEEEAFRYQGPKPATKETAIVMLADSVEAAIRSIPEPNKEKIENLIEKILQGKLQDGQLEESHLTLKELQRIKTVFMNTLLGIYHERIEYPEEEGNKI